MLWANKKFIQSVTFTEDAPDIALLEAIEQELSAAKYQTFSNLCKQALWQFLSVADSDPASSPLQQQLVQLQAQLGELQHNILTEEQNQFTRVEARLNRLAQQLAQIQANLDLQVLQVAATPAPQTAKKSPQPSPSPQPAPQHSPSPQPQQKSVEEPTDPLLKRLGSLIEDF